MHKHCAVIVMALVLGGLLASSVTVYAQADSKAGQIVVLGTVTNYDVGKTIEVDAKGTLHKYDLNNSDITYSISPEVATGVSVKVTETTDANGHKAVAIVLYASS
jgi:hypothetical protein